MGGSSSKNTQQQTQQTTTQLPAWMTDASQKLVGQAMNEKPLGAYGGQMTAGPSANQQAASAAAANGAGEWRAPLAAAGQMTQAAAAAPTANVTAAQQGVTAAQAAAPVAGQMQTATGYTAAGANGGQPQVAARDVTGSTFDAAAAAKYANPYQEQVQQNTLRTMANQDAQERAALGDSVQGAQAFGGTRQAVLEAQLMKDQGDRRQSYIDSSNAAGYDAARTQFNTDRSANDNLAVGNADRNLQGQTANASFLDQLLGRIDSANQFSADAANKASGANADRAQSAAEGNAGRQQQTNITNAGAANTAAGANADRQQDAGKTNAQLYETMLDRLLKGGSQMGQIAEATSSLGSRDVANLSGTGGVDQATTQAGLDAAYQDWLRAGNEPLDNVKDIMAVLSGAPRNVTTNGTSTGSTTSKQNAGLFNQLMGGAQLAGSIFSDRRLKTDISWIDNLENGLGVYRYRYMWDEPDSIPHIGVMADEVARIMPEALGPIVNGYHTVNYDKLGGLLPCY